MSGLIRGRPGPKKVWHENINLRLALGDKARFDAVLDDGETRLDLIRDAVYAEVERREMTKKKG